MTKIEWAEKAWNPVTGCTKISAGCKNCYAESMAKRFWCDRKFSDIQLHPDRLNDPFKWKKPKKIFVCSMADLFHEDVPMTYILNVFERMEQAKRHIFMVLTKRPERALSFYPRVIRGGINYGPKNIWIGVTAENQEMADKRIPVLMKIPAAVRFLSVEPMLGPVNLTQYYTSPTVSINWLTGIPYDWDYDEARPDNKANKLDWVICGSESGPKRRPSNPGWIINLKDQCVNSGTPFFLKQMEVGGKLVKMPMFDGRIWGEMP